MRLALALVLALSACANFDHTRESDAERVIGIVVGSSILIVPIVGFTLYAVSAQP